MKIRVVLAFLFCLSLILTQSAPALAQNAENAEHSPSIRVNWFSDSKNEKELVDALQKLYLVLYNTGNFPTKAVYNAQGVPIEDLLREQRLYFQAQMPLFLNSILCDLNEQICERSKTEVSHELLPVVDAHIGGYEGSLGEWNYQPDTWLLVPDIQLDNNTLITKVSAPTLAIPTESTAAYLDILEAYLRKADVKLATDCSEWGVSCEKLTWRLNAHVFPQSAKSGTGSVGEPAPKQTTELWVPVPGVVAEFSLTVEEASEVYSIVSSWDSDDVDVVQSASLNPAAKAFAPGWMQSLAEYSSTDIAVDALSENLVAVGDFFPQSVSAEPAFAEQSGLLSLISHPYMHRESLPLHHRKPVAIGVLDTWLDVDHCDLGPINVINATRHSAAQDSKSNFDDPAGDDANVNDVCGLMKEQAITLRDHGTHVVGLIGAQKNGRGTVGLNPYSQIFYYEIEATQLAGYGYRQDIATILTNLFVHHNVKIINLSWSYFNRIGGRDVIARAIKMLEPLALVVVAAGNANSHYTDGECSVLPACLTNLENVVSVVGLDRDLNNPQVWEDASNDVGSNSSAEFHIAAIADQVLSTTSNHSMGRLSGTSQAAAQVSAAASLLYSIYEAHYRPAQYKLSPVGVRNRLIYTADIFTELLDRVQSGRLNIERALDVANTYLVVDQDGQTSVMSGRLFNFGQDWENEKIVCRTPRQGELRISRNSLRRMFFDTNRQRYVVFHDAVGGDGNSPIEKLVDCQLRNVADSGGIMVDGVGEVSFLFSEIRDYISPMFD